MTFANMRRNGVRFVGRRGRPVSSASSCHRKRSIQCRTAGPIAVSTYIILIVASPLSAGLSVSGCVLRSDAIPGDRLPKIACADVFERPFFAPSEMLVPRQCGLLLSRWIGPFRAVGALSRMIGITISGKTHVAIATTLLAGSAEREKLCLTANI